MPCVSSTFQAQPLPRLSVPPPQPGPHPSPAQPRLQPPLHSAGHPSPHTQWVPSTSWDLTCLQPQLQHPVPEGLQPPICMCPLSSSVNPERSGGSSGQLPNRVCWWRDLAPRELEVSTGATAELEGLGDSLAPLVPPAAQHLVRSQRTLSRASFRTDIGQINNSGVLGVPDKVGLVKKTFHSRSCFRGADSGRPTKGGHHAFFQVSALSFPSLAPLHLLFGLFVYLQELPHSSASQLWGSGILGALTSATALLPGSTK